MIQSLKKIIIIAPFNIFPPYWGGANRIYNLTKELANENKIWLLCNDYKQVSKEDSRCAELEELSSNPNIEIFFVKTRGKTSQIFNFSVIKKGLEIIKKEKPDFILAEFVWSGLHAIILNLLTKTPYILDEHNVEFIRFDRMNRGNKFSRKMLRFYEKLSCTRASKILAVSNIDSDFLVSKLGIKKDRIAIIPNGFDTKKFHPDENKVPEIKDQLNLGKGPIILFFGKLDYTPNYEAVKIIRNEILPRILKKIPDTKFLIIGDNPPSEFTHKNIVFTGMVDKIEDFINTSDVVISPLLSGGGTRLKILEAIACGKVVVSTTVGAEGIDQSQIKDFLKISDDWEEFSKEILSAISRKPSNVPHEFVQKYSWAQVSEKVNQVLNSTDKGV